MDGKIFWVPISGKMVTVGIPVAVRTAEMCTLSKVVDLIDQHVAELGEGPSCFD